MKAPMASSGLPSGKQRVNKRRKLLTIGHSYVVALNRRLAHEMASVEGNPWEVTAVSPQFMCGDLRRIDLERFAGEACRLESVPTYLNNRIHLMLYGWRLRQLIQQPWDMVHCWEEPYIMAGGQIAWWLPKKTPFVFWTAQNLVKNYPPPFSWIERYCLGRCDGWLACGQTTARAQLARGYGGKPHRIIPLGLDLEIIRPDLIAGARTRRQLDWCNSETPVIGFLGRFTPEKGILFLMRVLDRLPRPWCALFVGGGPLEDSLRSWAATHQGRVRVVTKVPHDQVPAYLNAMDVLCAPSQTTAVWREQLGRMVIEAFACGVPVVASDSGEIPYVVCDAGVVVDETNEDGWVQAVADLLDSPRRRAELASRGLERAHAIFAWPAIARQHLDFFDELLN